MHNRILCWHEYARHNCPPSQAAVLHGSSTPSEQTKLCHWQILTNRVSKALMLNSASLQSSVPISVMTALMLQSTAWQDVKARTHSVTGFGTDK